MFTNIILRYIWYDSRYHQRTKYLQFDWSVKLQYIAYLKAAYFLSNLICCQSSLWFSLLRLYSFLVAPFCWSRCWLRELSLFVSYILCIDDKHVIVQSLKKIWHIFPVFLTFFECFPRLKPREICFKES